MAAVTDPAPAPEPAPGLDPASDPAPPLLRVVRGEPTAEELAALVAVIASLGGPADAPARRTPVWNAPRRLVRVIHRHGAGGWRGSALPR